MRNQLYPYLGLVAFGLYVLLRFSIHRIRLLIDDVTRRYALESGEALEATVFQAARGINNMRRYLLMSLAGLLYVLVTVAVSPLLRSVESNLEAFVVSAAAIMLIRILLALSEVRSELLGSQVHPSPTFRALELRFIKQAYESRTSVGVDEQLVQLAEEMAARRRLVKRPKRVIRSAIVKPHDA